MITKWNKNRYFVIESTNIELLNIETELMYLYMYMQIDDHQISRFCYCVLLTRCRKYIS